MASRPRVAVVMPFPPTRFLRGIEREAVKLANHLASSDLPVSLVSLDVQYDPASKELADYSQLLPSVTIKQVRARGGRSAFLGLQASTAPPWAPRLADIARRHDLAVVYNCGWPITLALSRFFGGLPMFYRPYWHPARGRLAAANRLRDGAARAVFARSAELWPASEAEAQQLRHRLQLAVPAHVIPPGVDLPASHLQETSVDVRTSLGIPPDALIAIVIGAASVFKGTDNALRTVSSARHLSGRDVRLVVVGADTAEVERMADVASIEDWPAFLFAVGRVSDERKSELLVASDVLLMLSQYESFGFVALEALAHGCSVITYDDFPSSSSLAAWGAAMVQRSDGLVTIARCLLGVEKTTRPSLPTWEQFGDQCLDRLLAHAEAIGV